MKTSKNLATRLLSLSLGIFVIMACSQEDRDRQIKADISIKAKEDIYFADVQFTVENSKVTLFGTCPTSIARGLIEQKLRTIHVIDSIEDHLLIAPVTIGSNFSMKKQVDSILANYSTVTAEVSDTSVMLIGKVKKKDLKKLLESIKKINSNTIYINHLNSSI